MSFKVLVIPEDPTHNGYILKPLVGRILNDAGKPNAKVTVLTNPRLTGYDHAVRAIKEDLPGRYGFWDLWLFMPDADRATPGAMQQLEDDLESQQVNLLCCPAVPEVEIYACVAFRNDLGASWDVVRASTSMKEDYFDPLLKLRGNQRKPGGGRGQMVRQALSNMNAVYQFCPELESLRDRLL
jgi:hypothetical protein